MVLFDKKLMHLWRYFIVFIVVKSILNNLLTRSQEVSYLHIKQCYHVSDVTADTQYYSVH